MLDRCLLEGEIRDLLSRPDGEDEGLRVLLEVTRPVDLAEVLPRLSSDHRLRIIRLLLREHAGTVLDEADDDVALEIVKDLECDEFAGIIEESPPDEAADLLGLLPDGQEAPVLRAVVDRGHAAEIRRLLDYDEDSVGGVMTTEFVHVPPEATVEEVLREVRAATEFDSVPYVYVVDEVSDRLLGVTSLRDLIEADVSTPIGDVMQTEVVTITPEAHRQEASRLVGRYDLVGLPVVDDGYRILGIVTFDDAMEVMDQEAEEDLFRMAGTAVIERPLSAPILRRIRARLPWLLVTLAGSMAGVLVLTSFEATLAEKTTLAFFIPVLAAMCGNVSIQSAAMLVRGFATGEVEGDRVRRIVLGEMLVGLGLGLVCGLAGGILATAVFGEPLLGVIVAVSMAIGMTVAILTGTLTPIVLVRFGVDPAVASGPFVTTLNDVTGLTTYFTTATVLLHCFPGR